ncbi:UNVERIFIED_CONTAM: hypothetical protein K2H54_057196 [Gekko kuhli]
MVPQVVEEPSSGDKQPKGLSPGPMISQDASIVPSTTRAQVKKDHIMRKLELCAFFDGIIQKEMFFLTVHDAVLHIQSQLIHRDTQDPIIEKISLMQESKEPIGFTETNQDEELDVQEEV